MLCEFIQLQSLFAISVDVLARVFVTSNMTSQ